MAELTGPSDVRERVRARYAAAARTSELSADAEPRASTGAEADAADECCRPPSATADQTGREVFGAALYREHEPATGEPAVEASLGCGVPTAVAELSTGETVLDLGSGAGADVLMSARRVGPTGRAIGLDMTDEMLELARRNAAQAGVSNVEFRQGYIEDIPLVDQTVDVVISNCVINLSADKPRVLREAARVLRPGGRLAVSDVIADADMSPAVRADMAAWTGCIAGALTRDEYQRLLQEAGFSDVEIRETHRVHEHAAASIIRARRAAAGCCSDSELSACCEPQAKSECCGSQALEQAPRGCGCAAGAR